MELDRINDNLDRSIEELEQCNSALHPEKPNGWAELDQVFVSIVKG